VKNRIKADWQKWKELSGVVCDRKMPVGIKGKVYKTIIRPVMIYGAEAWSPRRKEEELLESSKNGDENAAVDTNPQYYH